jgi:hypothetical protein
MKLGEHNLAKEELVFYGAEALGEPTLDSNRILRSNWFVYKYLKDSHSIILLEMTDDITAAEKFIIDDSYDNVLRSRVSHVVPGKVIYDYLSSQQLLVDSDAKLPRIVCVHE